MTNLAGPNVSRPIRITLLATFLALGVLLAPAGSARADDDVPVGLVCGAVAGQDDPAGAVERQDWPAAVAAQRLFVAQSCDNLYRWLELARYYQLAGKNAEALEIGAYAFAQKPNLIARLLREDAELAALRDTRGWADSAWGQAWASAVAERDRRIAQGQAQLAALPPERRLPDSYIARESCPFECCAFGNWIADEEIELFADAAGASLGVKLAKDERVAGLTGEVHLRPRPLLLQRAIMAYLPAPEGEAGEIELAVGEIAFELDARGEGFVALWHRGRVVDADAGLLLQDGCLAIDAECWGDYLDAPRENAADHQWWVKIRRRDGTEAWARGDGFGNVDTCGEMR